MQKPRVAETIGVEKLKSDETVGTKPHLFSHMKPKPVTATYSNKVSILQCTGRLLAAGKVTITRFFSQFWSQV